MANLHDWGHLTLPYFLKSNYETPARGNCPHSFGLVAFSVFPGSILLLLRFGAGETTPRRVRGLPWGRQGGRRGDARGHRETASAAGGDGPSRPLLMERNSW